MDGKCICGGHHPRGPDGKTACERRHDEKQGRGLVAMVLIMFWLSTLVTLLFEGK